MLIPKIKSNLKIFKWRTGLKKKSVVLVKIRRSYRIEVLENSDSEIVHDVEFQLQYMIRDRSRILHESPSRPQNMRVVVLQNIPLKTLEKPLFTCFALLDSDFDVKFVISDKVYKVS